MTDPPGDLAPPPSPGTPAAAPRAWAGTLALYAAAVAVTVAILFVGLRLDRADPHAPFAYNDDALLILPYVKEVIEKGTHWHTDRLGAPGTQQLHDFPVVDHLHFLVIWVMGRFFPDPVVVFNLYYLLTYPLTTVTALYALRRLGLSPAAALGCAVLYAFQPYHYLRGQVHYFLAAYYVVPLLLVVALEGCRGRSPFFLEVSPGVRPFRPLTRASLFPALVALATASAGAYYAFFSCFFLLAAGAYGWVQSRSWRAGAGPGLVLLLVVLGGLANHLPAFARQASEGQNPRPRERLAEEAELYGMKVAQLVLPVAGHNPVAFGSHVFYDIAAVRSVYQAPGVKDLNEADWDALGLVGALGYAGLLVCVCLPVSRRWPVGPLVALTAGGTLVGTLGGFGAVFNLLVSPQVRCLNRVSIFLAFLALAAAGFALDWLGRRVVVRFPSAEALKWPGVGLLLVFGVWDQTNDTWFPDIRESRPGYPHVETSRLAARRRFHQDREFFAHVERELPGGMVFTYPFVEYPESRPFREYKAAGQTDAYDSVVGYLHTSTVRWSFGAMKGREWDAWMRRAAGRARVEVPQFLERVTVAGFEGLVVDARGMNPDHFRALQDGLNKVVGPSALQKKHPDRAVYFYDLRPYRAFLLAQYGRKGFDDRARAEHESLVVLWPKGFWTYQETGYEDRLHWGARDAEMALVNRSAAPVTVTVRMRLRTSFKAPGRLAVRSELVTDAGVPLADDLDLAGDDKPVEYARTLVVPPGRHPVRFRCTPDTPVLPTDSRRLLFTVRDFRAE